jgi:hypothetical protein
MHDEPVMPMKIAIFGTDSLLAAHPVNWVQLTHACRKAGFDFLVPVSWGEELIAAHVGRQMADSATTSVMSSCPLVTERLRGFPVEVSMLNTVPPPVACARYVRAVFHPRPVHVTYVGGCPGAASEDVDIHVDADIFLIAWRLSESTRTRSRTISRTRCRSIGLVMHRLRAARRTSIGSRPRPACP